MKCPLMGDNCPLLGKNGLMGKYTGGATQTANAPYGGGTSPGSMVAVGQGSPQVSAASALGVSGGGGYCNGKEGMPSGDTCPVHKGY